MKNLTKKVIMVIVCAVLLGTVCGCGNDEYEKRIAELEKQLEETKKPEEIKIDYPNDSELSSAIEKKFDVTNKSVVVKVKSVDVSGSKYTFNTVYGRKITYASYTNPNVKAGDILVLKITELGKYEREIIGLSGTSTHYELHYEILERR